LELGLDPARLRRQAFCAWYSIASNTEGHTWFPAEVAASGVRSMVGGAEAKPARAIKMAKRICRLSKDTHGALAIIREQDGAVVEAGSNVFVAEGRKAWCEETVARIVAERLTQPILSTVWPDARTIDGITDHQKENLQKALCGEWISILGGSPGTGKTYTAARAIARVADLIGIDAIAVACPTGKAAVRITEAMQNYGLPLKARTWHSLLGVGEADSETGNWGFDHNEANPWKFKVIIGDESSMIDTNLMSSILRATASDCRLLLIGDVNQLPPVGHGAPLRDLIAAGVPYGDLREIKRNSGGIVETCAAIRDGKKWTAGDNLHVRECRNPSESLDAIIKEIAKAKGEGLDPVWDCQTLVAVNEKSKLGRKELNRFLQGELNQNAPIANCPFRINDKIVCLKNSDFPLIEDGSGSAEQGDTARVMNGELGKVVEIADKYFVVCVETPFRLIRVPRGKSDSNDTGCNWDLGYALSCHKSQGSEWPIVLVVIDEYPGAKMVCSREWIYTGISRAKTRCVLVGKKSVADQMCLRVSIGDRKTFLKELVLRNRAVIELAEM
jgi:exodeoxyribonuclease V alpha subunit